eukprot:TRINITY_DN43_c0_g1_i1.p1 TRINITY_DN43_c0_g1~~TRINITY_DN43_c0_g1_i1.p1  ORF type:complete len:547 (-),score=122.98 TRINITY_DN43_c0_g1_i1:1003-2643(-)
MQNGVRIRLNPLGGNQLNIREALRLYLPASATPSVSDDDDDQPTSPTAQPRPRTRAVVDDYDYEDDFIDDGDIDQPDDDDKQQAEFAGFGGFWVGSDDTANNHPVVDGSRLGNRLGNVVLEKLPLRHARPAQPHPQSQPLPSTANPAPPQQHTKQPSPSSAARAPSQPAASAPSNPRNTKASPPSSTAAPVTNAASHSVPQPPKPPKMGSKPDNVHHIEHAKQQLPAAPTSTAVSKVPSTKSVGPGTAIERSDLNVGPTATKLNNSAKAVTATAKPGAAGNATGAGATKTATASRSSKSAQALEAALKALQHFCAMKFSDKKPKLNDPVMQEHLHALLRAAISAGEAKLFSDIVREKRVVALSDELWTTVNKCLRTKRASLETLGHALIWSAREKLREKEVTKVEEVLKGYLQAKRGGAEVVRVEWSDELREMLFEWFTKKKELLAARNQLGSRVKTVKKSVNGWVASLKKSAFQGFSVAEEEIVRAFRAVEEKNKAKKRKREEERVLLKKTKKERADKEGVPRGENGSAARGSGTVANGEVIELD